MQLIFYVTDSERFKYAFYILLVLDSMGDLVLVYPPNRGLDQFFRYSLTTFSLNSNSGYWQIRFKVENQERLIFVCDAGMFHCKHMLLRLSNNQKRGILRLVCSKRRFIYQTLTK